MLTIEHQYRMCSFWVFLFGRKHEKHQSDTYLFTNHPRAGRSKDSPSAVVFCILNYDWILSGRREPLCGRRVGFVPLENHTPNAKCVGHCECRITGSAHRCLSSSFTHTKTILGVSVYGGNPTNRSHWCQRVESNHWPSAYEADVLTDWTTRAYVNGTSCVDSSPCRISLTLVQVLGALTDEDDIKEKKGR